LRNWQSGRESLWDSRGESRSGTGTLPMNYSEHRLEARCNKSWTGLLARESFRDPPATSRRQEIDFNQSVASSVVFAAHNRGGIAGWPGGNDGRLGIVWRGESTGLNLGLLRVFPVVIRSNESAVRVVQLQCRVGKHIRNSKLGQGRPQGTHNHPYDPIAGDKPSNHHILAGIDKAAGTNIR